MNCEGPTLETLDFANVRLSTPVVHQLLYFGLYLNTAYATHYINKISAGKKTIACRTFQRAFCQPSFGSRDVAHVVISDAW